MLLRAYERGVAGEVKPGDTIEEPRNLTIEEVHSRVDGLRLVGRRPGDDGKAKRVFLDVQAESQVERPVSDQDTLIDTLRAAFEALVRQQQEDEDQTFHYAWDASTKSFDLTSNLNTITLCVLDNIKAKQVHTPETSGHTPANRTQARRRRGRAAAQSAPESEPQVPAAEPEAAAEG